MKITTIYDYARFLASNCEHECKNCKLSRLNNGYGDGCSPFIAKHPDEANEIILKWCDEHPVKTYAEDFFEKFPKARRTQEGYPALCRNVPYNIDEDGCGDRRCAECWNEENKEICL